MNKQRFLGIIIVGLAFSTLGDRSNVLALRAQLQSRPTTATRSGQSSAQASRSTSEQLLQTRISVLESQSESYEKRISVLESDMNRLISALGGDSGKADDLDNVWKDLEKLRHDMKVVKQQLRIP